MRTEIATLQTIELQFRVYEFSHLRPRFSRKTKKNTWEQQIYDDAQVVGIFLLIAELYNKPFSKETPLTVYYYY